MPFVFALAAEFFIFEISLRCSNILTVMELSAVSGLLSLGSFLILPHFLGSQGNGGNCQFFEQLGDIVARSDVGHQLVIKQHVGHPAG